MYPESDNRLAVCIAAFLESQLQFANGAAVVKAMAHNMGIAGLGESVVI